MLWFFRLIDILDFVGLNVDREARLQVVGDWMFE